MTKISTLGYTFCGLVIGAILAICVFFLLLRSQYHTNALNIFASNKAIPTTCNQEGDDIICSNQDEDFNAMIFGFKNV